MQLYDYPDNGRMFGSLRSVASNAVAALLYVNEQRGQEFSVRQWVRKGRGVLFRGDRACDSHAPVLESLIDPVYLSQIKE